jgi:hypothetical protein
MCECSDGFESEFTKNMKHGFFIFLVLLLVFLSTGNRSTAQISRNHNVTVSVNSLTYISVSSASVGLSIDNSVAVAGVDAMVVTDQSSFLYWATNASTRKVTVSTDLGSPLFQIALSAVNVVSVDPSPGSATAAAEASLSTTARDFLLNIGTSMGYCNLHYTGTALASTGTGTDIHHLVYTVQTQ